MGKSFSVIIPAYNEERAIAAVCAEISQLGKTRAFDLEIIVVDDCSDDTTARVAAGCEGVRLIQNVQNFGYGYSIKRGILAAKHDAIIIIDGDGSYPVESISELIKVYERGFAMVVGARQGDDYRGSFAKYPARILFRWLAEFTAGRRIADINSGLRIFDKAVAMKYFATLPAGFSLTTTLTLACILNFDSIAYHPVPYRKRIGHSKVRYMRDILRTVQVMVEAILFYNPLKLYLLLGIIAVIVGIIATAVSLVVSPVVVGMILSGILASMIIFSIGCSSMQRVKHK